MKSCKLSEERLGTLRFEFDVAQAICINTFINLLEHSWLVGDNTERSALSFDNLFHNLPARNEFCNGRLNSIFTRIFDILKQIDIGNHKKNDIDETLRLRGIYFDLLLLVFT